MEQKISKATSLYFVLSATRARMDQERFVQYLQHQLKNEKFIVLQFVRYLEHIRVEVMFESVNKAKRAYRILHAKDHISLQGFSSVSLKSSIMKFKVTMESSSRKFIDSQNDKMKELRRNLQLLHQQSKRLSLNEFQNFTHYIDIIKSELEERSKQKIEFQNCCKEISKSLDQLESVINSTRTTLSGQLEQFQKRFARECIRLQKGLPIYAKCSNIVKIVSQNQVVILIGETGSGKSTQVVQYLYDAGFAANDKIIVCTQPRKVAAVTLANHVSTEMCSSPGMLVGYHFGVSGKVSSETKIVYMTDHSLLNDCIADRTFSKYSCLVIDEAHERSLSTDILLACIKQCLPYRPDLKVIVTSATIDPELFVRYFGSCPVIKVSGRMFPVDVIWNPLNMESTESPLTRDVVLDAIQVAKNILKEEPEGDILVFLTSPLQIENACQLAIQEMDKKTTIVLPLHGKLQAEDQRRVFEHYQGKRKIVFATNVAETSVTIPGIKYIIDSGLAKELCFDAKRNMNSLEVRLISKSSAEQRKGRAGRISAGKCYRMYTEDQYKSMADRTLPEILRMHLIHAVLKLYEFGIDDVLTFDFVEKPDESTLKAAIETLKFLGAIESNQLTTLGRQLALLPIDPQLGKVLLDGIKEDIGLEAAVSVSISSNGGTIFFRGGTDEMKVESDLRKIKFVHPAGDQMTCLSVYKEWSSCKKSERNKWCVENYINAKSMRIVEETIKELSHILQNSFQIELPKIFSLSKAETKLPKIYFFAFLRNLAMYLGHEWVGYMTLQVPDEPLVCFPGSSLVQCNLTPQYVIYEKTLKTSKHFLLQTISVEESWIDEAVSNGHLSQNHFEEIEKYKVTPFRIENLGQAVFWQAIKKNIKTLREEMMAHCGSSLVQMELLQSQVRVFSCTCYHNMLEKFLLDKIKIVREEMKKGFLETGVTNPQDDVKVVIGQGGLIEHVLMPHHFRTIIVKGSSSSHDWIEDAHVSLHEQGEVIKLECKEFKKENRIYATFSKPETAVQAINNMSLTLPEGVQIQSLLPKAGGELGRKFFRLKVEWTRRERQDFAFADFDSEVDCDIAYDDLFYSYIELYGSALNFRPSNKKASQLFISNVSRAISEEDITHEIKTKTLVDDVEVKIGFEKCYKTTDEQYEALKHQLVSLLSQHAHQHQFIVNLHHPADQHTKYRAFVDFENPEIGQHVMNSLKGSEIGGKPLEIQLMLSSSVRFTPQVHVVIADELVSVKQQIEQQFQQSIKVTVRKDKYGANVIVEISSDNVEAFGVAKKKLNNLIQPEVIECQTRFLQQYVFSRRCKELLSKIQSTTQTVVYSNTRSMTINIYGSFANRLQAAQSLKEEIKQMEEKGIMIHELQLKSSNRPPGLMKHLISRFGSNLHGITEMEGVESATIEPRRQILTVLSTSKAFDEIVQFFEGYSSSNAQHTYGTDETEECTICYCEIENKTDMYILEYCGHASHIECIELQVSTNAVTFPLCCAADGCSCPFVWQDLENLFKRTSLTVQSLVNSSLKSYLAANKDKVRNCPTPDCQMVYVVSNDGQRFICSQCNVHICTSCHVQFHDGLTCGMYKNMKCSDKSLKRWLRKDEQNHKLCPECSVPIEKNGGCNHVHCRQCKSFICWVCLACFESSQLCYAHLAKEHGSFA